MRKAVVSPGAVVKANNDLITLANSIGRTVNGNKCSTGASAGQFVVLLNSTISGRADGLYTASKAIPANTAIDSSYLTVADEGGLNALNSNLTSLSDQMVTSSAINIGATGHETSVKAWKTGNIAFVDFGGTYYGVSIPSGYVPKYAYNRMVAFVGSVGTSSYYPAIIAYNSGTFKIYKEQNGSESVVPEDGTYNVYGTICYAI